MSLLLRILVVALIGSGVQALGVEPPLKVVSTTSILHDIVQQIGNSWVEAKCLIPPGTDAHTWQPTPESVKTLADADLVIANGLDLETWIDELARNSGFKGRIVIASTGVVPLPGGEDDGDHGAHHDKASHTNGADPHIWQNVRNAVTIAENITNALASADARNASVYKAAGALYSSELSVLDSWIKRQIASIPADQRKLVTSHGAFQYFEAAYGLELHGIEGIAAGQEVSARQIADMIRFIREQNVRAVLIETAVDQRTAKRVAEEANVRIGGELFSDSLAPYPHPASNYIGMMRYNVLTILGALK